VLQGIRDRAQSWIMWVLVVIIIIPFALWGMHQYLGPKANIVVAEVNGRELTLREFQEAYQRQRYRLQTLLGAKFDASQLNEGRLKQEVLKQMIDDELLFQAAVDHGLRIGDAQLAASIRSLDVFKVDGHFSQETYESWLRRQGYVPASFEHSFRRSLLSAQLRAAIADSAIVTTADLDDAIRLQGQKRSFGYLLVPAARFEKDVTVTDEAVARYYENHRAEFVNPEQVSIAYVELARAGIAEGLTVSDEEVESRYQARKANYTTREQRRASHILVSVPKGASAEEEAKAREKAQALKRRLDAGESFEELARKDSDDPGSAAQGGDLGFFGRGMMDKPFEDAVFAMSVGEVSEPVRSSFGFHIIKLTGVQPAGVKPLDAVREQLRREIQLEKADRLFFDQADQLANLVFEHPDTLEPAAHALGLKVKTTGFFSRKGGTGVAADPKVVNAAFAEDVLVEGNNSELIELPGGRVIALRVAKHRPASQRSLDEVRPEITRRLRNQRARQLATQHGEGILSRLRAGAQPQAVAGEESLQWSERKLAGRDDASVARALLIRVFQLGHPSPGQPVFGGVALPSGDYAVISVTKVQDGDPNAAGTARSTMETRLERARGDELFDAFVQALRERAKIKIYADRL
jgi:peptidyl-prolyl cis-trans isomerase D